MNLEVLRILSHHNADEDKDFCASSPLHLPAEIPNRGVNIQQP